MMFVEPYYDTAWNQANARVHVSIDGEKTLCGRKFIVLWRKKTFQDFLLYGCQRCRNRVFKDACMHSQIELPSVCGKVLKQFQRK